MNHKQECLDAQAKAKAAIAAYEQAWPNYCRLCGGWGQFHGGYTTVPYGSTTASFENPPDPCSVCFENGICPRCGQDTIDPESDAGCAACGWTEKDGGMPPEYDGCYCWEEEASAGI